MRTVLLCGSNYMTAWVADTFRTLADKAGLDPIVLQLSDANCVCDFCRIGGAFPIYKLTAELVKSYSPVAAFAIWQQMIPADVLNIPDRGFVGFHCSKLPDWRGRNAIPNTILHGLRETGETMFYLTGEPDKGGIIGFEPFEVEDDDTSTEVYEKASEAIKRLLVQYFQQVIDGTAPRIPQGNGDWVFKPVERGGITIDLDEMTTQEITEVIRAQQFPYPCARIVIGNKTYRVVNEADL